MLNLNIKDLQDYTHVVISSVESFAQDCIKEERSNELCKEMFRNWLYVESYINNEEKEFFEKLKSYCEGIIDFYYELFVI